jgi:regulator of nonsense transcripts 1
MENTDSIFTLKQNILPQHVGEISVTRVQENHLSSETLKQFLSSVCDGMIGLAPTYGKKQRLSSIAFASRDRVLNVELLNCRSTTQQRKVLQATILLNDSYKKYAFYMDTLATSLFYDCSLPINGAIDILSGSRESRHLLKAVIEVLGGESKVNRKSVRQLFRQEESSKADRITVATQAWAAYQSASTQPPFMVPNTIDTTLFSIEVGSFIVI